MREPVLTWQATLRRLVPIDLVFKVSIDRRWRSRTLGARLVLTPPVWIAESDGEQSAA
ncbi:MAG TPA: hypothetical protein VK698_02870 [Kofleriaceae bacterium]|nr:hypothetical protein [Kofleriaceae bacterium]